MNIKEFMEKYLQANTEEGARNLKQEFDHIAVWSDWKSALCVQVVDWKVHTKTNNQGNVIYVQCVNGRVSRDEIPKFKVWTTESKILINKTPNGVKIMGIDKNGQPVFADGIANILSRFKISVEIANNVDWKIAGWISANYQPEQFVKLTQYMEWMSPFTQLYPDQPWFKDIRNSWMRDIGMHPGIKQTLNNAYHKRGQTKMITKNAFGGYDKITSLDMLEAAIAIVRGFDACNPHIFEAMGDKGVMSEVMRDTKDFYAQRIDIVGLIRYMVTFLGASNNDVAAMWIYYGLRNLGYMYDTVNMLKKIKSHKVRNALRASWRRNKPTWKEFHDTVNLEFSRIKTPLQEIEGPIHQLDGHKISDEIISITPKTTHDLIQWGAEYGICIGSYASEVANGFTICMGFWNPIEEEFWGFAEIRQGRLQQLLGRFNAQLPIKQRVAITDWLKTQKVNVDHYWGDGY